MRHEDRIPVLVGVAESVERDPDPAHAPEPLESMADAARGAAEDAGVGDAMLAGLDTVGVVDVIGWRPRNAPDLLSEVLGAHPARKLLSAVGGEMPLTMVNDLAGRIAAGNSESALLAGTNNLRTFRRARKAGLRLGWNPGGRGEPELIGETRAGSSEREQGYGLRMPTDIYPVFENAMRARRGLDLETHRARVGRLMSGFTRVAAANPNAWFPVERSAEEITRAAPENRMIAYPYTKYMNAVMETDQSAALLLTSVARARALGIPEERWIYWWGGAHTQERAWFPTERDDLGECDALRATAQAALARAGTSLDAVDHIDFYSCFPVAVEMACEMLGLDEEDPRGFTVTGGLPYAGGPGNAYTLHSIAAMARRLRARPGDRGLVTGNGWYLTKHAASVFASTPRDEGVARDEPLPDEVGPGPIRVVEAPDTLGTIESYTVLYDREGAPSRGIVVGRTECGERFLANTPEDREWLESFAAVEAIGRTGRVRGGDEHNHFDFI